MNDEYDPDPMAEANRLLGLPPDTITVRGSEVRLFYSAAGDGTLQPELAVYTHEFGWYRIQLDDDAYAELLRTAVGLSNLTDEERNEKARELHQPEGDTE